VFGTTGYQWWTLNQLNKTGYMHNRTYGGGKFSLYLLINWQWEKLILKKLLDYEMSSNVGNWQWAGNRL
jgi:deoxyribodipyrimidine photo-lyase